MKNKLPNGWKEVTLAEVSLDKGQYGSGASAVDYNQNKPRYIRITDIDDNGVLKSDGGKSPSITEEKYFLDEGDFLFARSGSVGRTYLHDNKKGIYQYAGYLIRFKLNKKKILPKYLFYVTKSKYYWSWIEKQQKSVTISNINARQYAKFKFILPPIQTQQKIVAILEKAEKLKEWRKDADALTDDFLKSVFLDMFGDPLSNPKEWHVIKLGRVGILARGKSKHRPRNAPELLGGKHPLIQTGEVANSKGYITEYVQTYSDLGLKQSKMWSKGTLCITIAANIARTGILTFDACFPDSIVGFTPNDKVKTEYIQYWLSFLQKLLEENAPESAQKNINLKILSNLDVPVPPIELQQKFALIVEKVEEMRNAQKQSKASIDGLFCALMQKAFKGELV